ncbi:hypothetical protein [Thermococcus waiotapuensis]|uniref:Uncharacterized protein n=1 Tax=Thermococcus waiotapuensis TaxID=90909 RepID=A0AAE4NS47_9EURY|nr:hypothetical protein [Thermococcus waiotapuensis]MDV3103333.1 hypothetical protein [Thermococcus waiotapuensis]
MPELDFEIPVHSLNPAMNLLVEKGIFIRWLFLNEDRGTFSIRLVVPNVGMEEILLDLARILNENVEISIVHIVYGEKHLEKIDQAFLVPLEIGDSKYPVVVFMEFDFNPRVPSKVVIITEKECSEDIIKAILRSQIGPFTLEDPSNIKIVNDSNMVKIIVKSSPRAQPVQSRF